MGPLYFLKGFFTEEVFTQIGAGFTLTHWVFIGQRGMARLGQRLLRNF